MSRESYVYVIVNRETGKFGALLETFRTIRCAMDFEMYPLDRQRCRYLIGSVANKLGLKVGIFTIQSDTRPHGLVSYFYDDLALSIHLFSSSSK